MIEPWVFAIGVVTAWANGAIVGYLYRTRQDRQGAYRIAKGRFEEQRERVMKHLKEARDD